ncbi:MAG: helix-turn-helix transcriptional regulator [Steroidobacteraceae bacterium]
MKLGENLRIARKRRGLRIVDLAQAAGCSQDTLRRLESGDPGVSLGVLARVAAAIGRAQELASVMDAAKDFEGLKGEVQRLPQRVRRALLPVERVSAEGFWNEKRARQAASHSRVVSGEIPQSALFAFSAQQLRGAEFKWPKGGCSALENDDDVEERSASALQR